MCLTKGPQSLGSSAGLGIHAQKGLWRQVLEAFEERTLPLGKGSQDIGGRREGAGFWHHGGVTPPQTCHDAMSQGQVHKQ